jgi:hypothetical protein
MTSMTFPLRRLGKRVLGLHDEAEELLLKAGSDIGACPRYLDSDTRARRSARASRRPR